MLAIWVQTAMGQNRAGSSFSHKADTVYSRDTMTVRSFRKDGKIRQEDRYVTGKLVSEKKWYYSPKWHRNNEVFGYYLTDKTRPEPQMVFIKEFFINGNLRIEGTTLKGKKHGKYKTYYQNGQIQCDCNYRFGLQDSTQVNHFDNGQVMVVFNYHDGNEDGKTVYYFDNGQVWSERMYVRGKLWNVLSSFDKKGSPLDKGTIKDGNGTFYIYDENGRLSETEYYREGKVMKTDKK